MLAFSLLFSIVCAVTSEIYALLGATLSTNDTPKIEKHPLPSTL